MGLPIARLFGIEIRLQLGWVLVVALVAVIAEGQVSAAAPDMGGIVRWVVGGVVALGFLLSAMLHDLAHAIAARRAGIAVPVVVVSFFGGATPFDPSAEEPRAELRIALAGPAASLAAALVLAAAALVVGGFGGLLGGTVGAVLLVLAVLNAILGGVNLVPGYPLDGGRIVRAAVWQRTGDIGRGWAASALLGRLSGFGVVAAGLAIAVGGELTNGAMVGLAGWFLVLSARAIRERVRVEALLGDLRVSDVLEVDGPSVGPSLTLDTFAEQLLGADAPRSAVAVLDGGEVVGVLGVRQVERVRRDRRGQTRVEAVMVGRGRLPRVSPGDRLTSAAERLLRSGADGLPVFDGDRYAGLLTRRDIGRAVRERSAAADR